MAALLALAGCGVDIGERYLAGTGDAAFSRMQRFVGTVSGCGAATKAVLTLEGRHFALAPSEGVEVINGTREGAGLSGSWAAQTGAAPSTAWSFTGILAERTISGALRKPGCTAQVELHQG